MANKFFKNICQKKGKKNNNQTAGKQRGLRSVETEVSKIPSQIMTLKAYNY